MSKISQTIGSMNNRSVTGYVRRAACGALVTVTAGLLLWQPAADACTRVLWNNNKLPAVVSGRSMDRPESTEPVLTVLPRGMKRDGGRAGSEVVVGSNPALWTSRYGSLVTTIYGMGTANVGPGSAVLRNLSSSTGRLRGRVEALTSMGKGRRIATPTSIWAGKVLCAFDSDGPERYQVHSGTESIGHGSATECGENDGKH